MKEKFLAYFRLLKETFTKFSEDKALKMSASLSYYSILSLGPLLFLIVFIAGIFFRKDIVTSELFHELNSMMGADATAQIKTILRTIDFSDKSTIALIIGIVTTLLTATSVFGDMQDSINTIWGVKPKPKRGWVKMIKDRFRSSSLIVSISFLLIISFLVNGVIDAFSSFFSREWSSIVLVFVQILNFAFSYIIISILFGVIFKLLPDVRIKWKDVRAGALFTGALFMIGRFLIGYYITTTGTGSNLGAAGTIIVILVWIYYSTAILYIGAAFTKKYAEFRGRKLLPAEYAVYVETQEIESKKPPAVAPDPQLQEDNEVKKDKIKDDDFFS